MIVNKQKLISSLSFKSVTDRNIINYFIWENQELKFKCTSALSPLTVKARD